MATEPKKSSGPAEGLEPQHDRVPKRVWLWWSSGKDSAWTLHRLRSNPEVAVERLVTTITPHFGRVAIHGTRIEVLQAQAEAVGLPLETVELPYPCTNDDYLDAVAPLLQRAASRSVDQMAFGDLFLEDIREYRETLFAGTGIEPIFPLWQEDTNAVAADMLRSGLEAYVTTLDPQRVDPSLAGVRYDDDFLRGLPDDVDPCGENGEFHTCVAAGPMMAHRLDLERGEIVERGGFVYADLFASHLGSKEGT
ncbi:MAG: adenine nucleotide alpha hydrolase [Thermoanaerobaculia bacterium]|nr:adenine nucleotide alpha hydrolase [Thermoanaerobaculia bacterium]